MCDELTFNSPISSSNPFFEIHVEPSSYKLRKVSSGTEISAESARCLADVMLASDEFRNATAESLVSSTDPFDDPALVAALLPAMLECITAEELADLGNA